MGWDGYYQVLCEVGHYHGVSYYGFEEGEWKCLDCGKGPAWLNLVDTTNWEIAIPEEKIEAVKKLTVKYKKQSFICPGCGLRTKMQPTVYNIPDD